MRVVLGEPGWLREINHWCIHFFFFAYLLLKPKWHEKRLPSSYNNTHQHHRILPYNVYTLLGFRPSKKKKKRKKYSFHSTEDYHTLESMKVCHVCKSSAFLQTLHWRYVTFYHVSAWSQRVHPLSLDETQGAGKQIAGDMSCGWEQGWGRHHVFWIKCEAEEWIHCEQILIADLTDL